VQDLQHTENITKERLEVRIEEERFIESECGELRGIVRRPVLGTRIRGAWGVQVGDKSELRKGEKGERERASAVTGPTGLQGDVRGVSLRTAFPSVIGKARKQERVL
jgi:hypothetical protein